MSPFTVDVPSCQMTLFAVTQTSRFLPSESSTIQGLGIISIQLAQGEGEHEEVE